MGIYNRRKAKAVFNAGIIVTLSLYPLQLAAVGIQLLLDRINSVNRPT